MSFIHVVHSTFHINKLFLNVYISGIQMVHLHQLNHSFSCKMHTNCTDLKYNHQWNIYEHCILLIPLSSLLSTHVQT